jgi:prepilin-type N-terminal cleavage/methylation domain-containing protein
MNKMRNDAMEKKTKFNMKGITLIELLVALVICGIVVAGIYRVFVAQTRAYTVQDQTVEVQQNVRSAMELILRDLRMAGYDDDNVNSPINITDPIVIDTADNSHVRVKYEYYNTATIPPQYETRTVDFSRDAVHATLLRTLIITPAAGASSSNTETLLDNVDALNFRCGVDTNDDGAIDNWVDPAAVGAAKVIALRVLLTARPDQTNPDVQTMVVPRRLESIVTLRNRCLIRF